MGIGLRSTMVYTPCTKEIWDTNHVHVTVLALPFEEIQYSLRLIPVTTTPLAAIAEQVTLVHINDLYSRLFVKLVEAAEAGKDGVWNHEGIYNVENGKMVSSPL